MRYKDATKLKPSDKFTHRKWTGIYTIVSVEILPKTVRCKCTDGYTYHHQGIKAIIADALISKNGGKDEVQ